MNLKLVLIIIIFIFGLYFCMRYKSSDIVENFKGFNDLQKEFYYCD